MIDNGSFGHAAMRAGLALAAVLGIAACDRIKDRDKAPVYTLYQSNPLDLTARVHFATFNSALKGEQKTGEKSVNQSNCEMAAEVLNEKIRSANNGGQPVRYWCEKGKYKAAAKDE
jgi:hypothetical protein